jgi:DNA-binding LacI/PurR family transcriptional regulator
VLARAGIREHDVPVVSCWGDVAGGRVAAASLLALDPSPTAILCYNDLVAVGALHAIADAGLTAPGDVSVVGFDDIPVASMVSPALTTVAQEVAVMAHWAVDRIVGQIAARWRDGTAATPAVIREPCRLVIRASTSTPPPS